MLSNAITSLVCFLSAVLGMSSLKSIIHDGNYSEVTIFKVKDRDTPI